MRVYVRGIGLTGPGLSGWEASRDILAGRAPYRHAPTVVPAVEWLPAAERRRTGTPVKLALGAGSEALAGAGCDPAATPTVFASSSGDCDNVHAIFETLATAQREVSPTRFHNSVHNAAAGYWSIATRSRESSTSLSCHDASFAAGLLESAAQAAGAGTPIALVAYDHPYPEPLNSARPVADCFGVALVLGREPDKGALAALDVTFEPESREATRMEGAALEAVRGGTPAARSLPLLAAIARGTGADIVLEYLPESHLRVVLTP